MIKFYEAVRECYSNSSEVLKRLEDELMIPVTARIRLTDRDAIIRKLGELDI